MCSNKRSKRYTVTERGNLGSVLVIDNRCNSNQKRDTWPIQCKTRSAFLLPKKRCTNSRRLKL